eukprot:3473943-Pleurochrysis_carterae.AAC.1
MHQLQTPHEETQPPEPTQAAFSMLRIHLADPQERQSQTDSPTIGDGQSRRGSVKLTRFRLVWETPVRCTATAVALRACC